MTGKAKKTGKELERRVADAYRKLCAKKVEHDVELAGNQIDVYVELETADRSLHRIAVEAKDWTSRVGIDIVNDFAPIVDLLRRERLIEEGIIVSAAGFSRPARNAAQTYSIRLLEVADLDAMVAKATGPTPPTAPPIPPPPTLYDKRLQRDIQDQAAGLALGVAPQPKGHKMIEVRFASETLAQYRVYSLCCQKLLDSYEELSEVCDIDTLVGIFDVDLRNSYCGDKYDLGVESVDLFLQRLINRYSSNADAREKLIAIRQAILGDAGDWDFHPALIEFGDIGKGLAQDFYREGGRALNIELINSKDPVLVFSNLCLSETTLFGFTEPRPISTLPDGIHLPFTKKFKFCYYLSYPFLFLHEYTSHVYVPRIDSRTFDDGWLMYAIELFMKTRWPKLCKRYPLIRAQRNVLWKIWLPRFTWMAKKGYEIARDVDACLGDSDRFLQFTWDLASYPSDYAGHLSFHDDFLNLIERFTQRDRGDLLRSAVENSIDALQLYENLKVGS